MTEYVSDRDRSTTLAQLIHFEWEQVVITGNDISIILAREKKQ